MELDHVGRDQRAEVKVGVDQAVIYRSFVLKHVFEREILKRMDMKCNKKETTQTKRKDDLPRESLKFF